MTYIELINDFWKKNLVSPLTSCEAYLYFYMLKECNLGNWKNPFELPTRKIEFELSFPRKLIVSARNTLKQRGFIDFKEGRGRASSAVYEIIGILVSDRNINGNINGNINPSPIPPIEKTKDKKKEESPNGDKKKSEPSLFGDIPTKSYNGTNIDFVADEWFPIFTKWLEYKRQRRETYKGERSLKTCYNQLLKYAENNLTYADYIVDRSIANNWQGLFPLKQSDIDFITKQKEYGTSKHDPKRGAAAPDPRNAADVYGQEVDSL